jgi:hypothetical protein
LKYAKNPSAVVMIAIRGVAAKVGRRYYGTREAAEGDATQAVGELKMSLARTVARTSHDTGKTARHAETRLPVLWRCARHVCTLCCHEDWRLSGS